MPPLNIAKFCKAAAVALMYFGGMVLWASPADAAAGTEGAAFLEIPVGAAPAAMGSAYSALATDAYAPIYNPAGLGFVDQPQVAGQHLAYLDSVHYEFASVVYPLPRSHFATLPGNSALGASIQYLGSGAIPRTNLNGESLGDFSSSYAAYSLAYGRTLGDHLSLGLTGKVIQGSLNGITGRAYAADVGGLYRRDRWAVAAVLTHLGTALKFIRESNPLPRALHLSGAYHVARDWDVSLEAVTPQSRPTSVHAGVQWSPLDVIAIRAGYKTDTLKELSAMAGLTAGVGIFVWGQELAYAWAPYGDLGDTQYFSIVLRFGERARLKRNLIQFQSRKRHPAHSGPHGSNDSEQDIETLQLMQLLQSEDTPRMSEAPSAPTKERP